MQQETVEFSYDMQIQLDQEKKKNYETNRRITWLMSVPYLQYILMSYAFSSREVKNGN